MTLSILSANIPMRTTARSVSASEILPAQTDVTKKEEGARSIGDILSQRMKIMQQASRDMLSKMNTVSESRKAAARQRLELAKERIKMLKMLVSSGLASKGVLREIRALAKELGQIAKELSGDSQPAGTAENTDDSPVIQEGEAEQADRAGNDLAGSNGRTETESEAELQADSDIEAEAEAADESANVAEVKEQAISAQREVSSLGAYLHHQNHANANQRRQDAESIKEVLSLLKSLVNSVRNMGWDDTESRKELQQINRLLSDTENIATDMAGGVLAGFSLGNIVSVSI